MKTIGLIGGTTWGSTAEYYRIINQEIARALGGANSSKLVLVSLNFEELLSHSKAGDLAGHRAVYSDAARRLEFSGADFIVICSNTGHRRAEELRTVVSIPILHIADSVGSAIVDAGVRRVGLLGTAATMAEDFIRGVLAQNWNLDVVVPDQDARSRLDSLIMSEMARGIFSAPAREWVASTVDRLAREASIEAVILGCTELPLLLGDLPLACPAFDSLRLHAVNAARHALLEIRQAASDSVGVRSLQ